MPMTPKILLVDDRDDNLLSIESILEPDGYKFVKARSGRQTLKILLSEMDFALILMDVNMPDLNGFETAALIYEREKLKHIPIVFITAHDYGDENVFEGYRAGAVDYIYKPIKADLLRAKVAVFVDLYMKKAQLIAQEQKLTAINKSLELEIADRKTSEEKVTELNMELIQNVSRLETANKELDLFAFMASHDLQAPVRKIRMFSERLLSGYSDKLDEEGNTYLDRIQKVCNQMQQLINDILEFSKISVKKELFQEVNVNHLLSDILAELDGAIQEKGIRIIVDAIPELCVNPILMHQLFLNLISNAVKYSRKTASPYIRIHSEAFTLNKTVDRSQQRVKYCRIFIEDNGIGFDQKYAEEIFDMFRRLHPAKEYEGTGIGLALCKKIVEKHNGFISVKSKIDHGSTFIISLPFEHPVAENDYL
jgi:light-regulated signal transduction histidine kinase (bacteriophytochrome)